MIRQGYDHFGRYMYTRISIGVTIGLLYYHNTIGFTYYTTKVTYGMIAIYIYTLTKIS